MPECFIGTRFFNICRPVAPDNTYGQRAPRIALITGNTPLVYWGKTGAASTLYLARWL
ncbi:MAG: hypothetical protein KDD10_24100 [Phaeodactylibacter sp.]|nr:hypothetical protein [Phaeodactylibacter sp.]MCB9295550.1 hypothetical protein [Lewinellaceae bacterium]